jgi:topoisomerase IV subunit A
LRKLIVKYGADYPRKTRIKAIEEIDRRAIETKEVKVKFDLATGFVGTKVSGGSEFTCTNFDKILIFYQDGTYKAMNIPEKQYFEDLIWTGVADKKTILNVVYKDAKTCQAWAKRFIVEKFILDKTYRYLDEGAQLELMTTDSGGVIELQLAGAAAKKSKNKTISFNDIPIKGAQTKGIRLGTEKVKKVTLIAGKKGNR